LQSLIIIVGDIDTAARSERKWKLWKFRENFSKFRSWWK